MPDACVRPSVRPLLVALLVVLPAPAALATCAPSGESEVCWQRESTPLVVVLVRDEATVRAELYATDREASGDGSHEVSRDGARVALEDDREITSLDAHRSQYTGRQDDRTVRTEEIRIRFEQDEAAVGLKRTSYGADAEVCHVYVGSREVEAPCSAAFPGPSTVP